MTLAPARDPYAFSPVFLLATPRSYSSVVCTMVGQHPECVGFPELKLFAYDTIHELEQSLPRFWSDRGITHRSPGLVRAIAHFEFGDQGPDGLLAARAWLRQRSHWSGADVFDALLRRASPRTAVEKSPENVSNNTSLERLAATYPNARYLHLTRHPITTQRSMEAHLNRTVPGITLPDQPMLGVATWLETQCWILRFGAVLPPERYLRVKGEDVLNHSRQQLRDIASWIGVRTDEEAIEAMTHPERAPFANFGALETGIVGGNDHGFLHDPILRPAAPPPPLKVPDDWVGHASLWEMTVEIAGRLGYS